MQTDIHLDTETGVAHLCDSFIVAKVGHSRNARTVLLPSTIKSSTATGLERGARTAMAALLLGYIIGYLENENCPFCTARTGNFLPLYNWLRIESSPHSFIATCKCGTERKLLNGILRIHSNAGDA